MTYPEHEKLSKVKGQTQAIGEFIDWCAGRGIELCELSRDEYWPVHDFMDLLAAWAGIDPEKIEDEKLEMIATMRRMNGIED